MGLGTHHMGDLGVWQDHVGWRTPARDWGSRRGRQGKGTRVWVELVAPPSLGGFASSPELLSSPAGAVRRPVLPGAGGPAPVPLGHPPTPTSPRPAGEHGHRDPGVQQARVQGRHHGQEAEGAGRVGLGSRAAPPSRRDDPEPLPPPSGSGDGGTEPLTEQELHEFSEAMKLTASQDPRPTGWRAARLASPCPSVVGWP